MRVRFLERVSFIYWILAAALLIQAVPWLHRRLTGVWPFALAVIWIMFVRKSSTYRFPRLNSFRSRVFAAFAMACVCYLSPCVHWLFGHGNLTQYHEFASLVTSIVFLYVLYLLVKSYRLKELKFLTLVVIIGLIVYGISSIRGFAAGVEGTRTMAGLSYLMNKTTGPITVSDDMIAVQELGLGGYGTIYNSAILMGPIFYAIFRCSNNIFRIILSSTLVGLYFAVRGSGLGTPMFVMTYSLVLSVLAIFIKKPKVIAIFGMLGILFLCAYIVSPVVYRPFSYPLLYIAENMQEGSTQRRIQSVALALSGDKSAYANERYDCQRLSFSQFCKTPLFGCGTYNYPDPRSFKLGGHSYLLDKMGREGFSGAVFYLLWLFLTYKAFERCTNIGLSRDWLVMPLIVLFSHFFTAIANPIPIFPGYYYIVLVGIAMFFKGSIYGTNFKIPVGGFYGFR